MGIGACNNRKAFKRDGFKEVLNLSYLIFIVNAHYYPFEFLPAILL